MAKAKVEESFGEVDTDDQVEGASFGNADEGLVVDLENVEAMSFDAIPTNTYDVIIKDAKFGMSKADKPKWDLQLSITSGEYENRIVFETLSFSPGALPGTKSKLLVLAPEIATTRFNPADEELVATLIGRRFRAKVGIQKGTTDYPDDRNTVKKYFPAEGEAAFG